MNSAMLKCARLSLLEEIGQELIMWGNWRNNLHLFKNGEDLFLHFIFDSNTSDQNEKPNLIDSDTDSELKVDEYYKIYQKPEIDTQIESD